MTQVNAKEATLFSSVLLIEDDAAHRLIIERLLAKLIPEVQVVPSLARAKQAVGERSFELLVSDLHLPDAGDQGPVPQLLPFGIPVMVLTSSSAVNDAVRAMQQGASDFLVKDFDALAETLPLALARLYSRRELDRERERLELLASTLKTGIELGRDGMALLRRDATIDYANHAFLSALGVSSASSMSELLAQTAGERAATETATFEQMLVDLKPGATWSTEMRITTPHEAVLEFTLIGLPAPSNRADGLVACCTLKDMTVTRRRERFQRDLLSTTTHDLKGPLGAIRLSAELLEPMTHSSAHPKARELALRIASSAQGALNLIEEFLNARRLQEGSLVLRPKPVPVRDILTAVEQDFSPIALARGITISIADTGTLEAVVDKLAVVRAMSNLVGNAIKFTPRGGTVAVAASTRGDAIEFAVTDTGAGMTPGELSQLFERFSRLERHQEVSGTGLGLYLVKHVVQAHGGRIDVQSNVGTGTTFRLLFPKAPPVNERGELFDLSAIDG